MKIHINYIKNLRSGKYLTVQGGSLTSGANIVQWGYTGDNNQKWKLHYTGDTGSDSGNYIFYAYNTSYVIAMPNGSGNSGLQAQLASPSTAANRKYFVVTGSLGNAAHRFFTKASNCNLALVANNASIYNNTSIVQDNIGGQWNDQWLFEPVEKDVDFGIQYANDNQEHRLATYMNFDHYTDTTVPTSVQPALRDSYESANFVSQCLNAYGKHYNTNDTTDRLWYSNKNQHIQNVQLTQTTLSQYWDIASNWYRPQDLCDYIINICQCNHDKFHIENYYFPSSCNAVYKAGDVIQISANSGTYVKNLFTGYIKYSPDDSGLINTSDYRKNYVVASHSTGNAYTNWTIGQLCQYFQTNYNATNIEFFKCTT